MKKRENAAQISWWGFKLQTRDKHSSDLSRILQVVCKVSPVFQSKHMEGHMGPCIQACPKT